MFILINLHIIKIYYKSQILSLLINCSLKINCKFATNTPWACIFSSTDGVSSRSENSSFFKKHIPITLVNTQFIVINIIVNFGLFFVADYDFGFSLWRLALLFEIINTLLKITQSIFSINRLKLFLLIFVILVYFLNHIIYNYYYHLLHIIFSYNYIKLIKNIT